MKKFTFSFKSLFLAAGLLLGSANAWGDVVETVVVNQNFDDGTTTLFSGVSRMTVSNDNNVKFTCAGNSQNGYSLATYDFSSAIGEGATAVKIEFLFWIPNQNAAYHRFFTVGQANLRTGFGKNSYSTAGSMFAFGLARNSSANYFSINRASTTAAASAGNVLGAWARAEIYVDHSTKTVNYKITNVENTTTYYSANSVAFVDGSASYCNQLDFFDCQNNVVSYLDNLVITKYVDQSKVATTYTVKYQNSEGTDLKDPVVYNTYVGDTYTASASDMASFYSVDTNKKYVYKSGNTSAEASSTAASNVITLVFDEYTKYTATASAISGGSSLQSNIASVTTYSDETAYLRLPKYLKVDDIWYVTETSNVLKTATEAGDTEVEYTISNIDYFFEETDFSLSRSFAATTTKDFFSRGNGGRLYSNSYGTTAELEGGVYDLVIAGAVNTQTPTMTYGYKLGDSDYVILGESPSFSNASYESTKTVRNVVIPDGARFCWINNTGYNSNLYIDYVTLTKVGTVSATVTVDGYATYVPSYDLDFSATSIEAYKVKVSSKGVATLTKVNNVPANTPVLLYKKGGATEDIPVMTGAAAVTDNDLVAGTGAAVATTDGEYTNMILNKVDEQIGFYFAAGNTVAANRAYLHIATSLAPDAVSGVKALNVVFADDTATGVEAPVAAETVEDAVYYNLNGQVVTKDYKGIVIVNGKKFYNK